MLISTIKLSQNTNENILLDKNIYDFTEEKKLHFRCPVTIDREDHDSQMRNAQGLNTESNVCCSGLTCARALSAPGYNNK